MKVSRKSLLFLSFVWSLSVFAQNVPDTRFRESQRTSTSPFSLPISVTLSGDVSFLSTSETAKISFKPNILAGFSRKITSYSESVLTQSFGLFPIQEDLGFVEVKQQLVEFGLGLSAAIQGGPTLGFVPYKGAKQTLITHKKYKLDKGLNLKIPSSLQDLESWSVGDSGTYQTYGGIEAWVGFGISFVNIAKMAIGFQNQFILEIKKINDDEISLSIMEEDLKRRRLSTGAVVLTGTMDDFTGKRMGALFILNLKNPQHADLYKAGLKGNLKLLQDGLPFEAQKIAWVGNQKILNYGIPLLLTKVKTVSHYELIENDTETEIDMESSASKGYLAAPVYHDQVVFQSDKNILILWSTLMSKSNLERIDKYFLSKARTVGGIGFEKTLRSDYKTGRITTQLGMIITKEDFLALQNSSMTEISSHLRERCVSELLECQKEKVHQDILSNLTNVFERPWKDGQGQFGLLLLKEPALIYSMMKTLNLKKELYFKFISEVFQSLEGSTRIEI